MDNEKGNGRVGVLLLGSKGRGLGCGNDVVHHGGVMMGTVVFLSIVRLAGEHLFFLF